MILPQIWPQGNPKSRTTAQRSRRTAFFFDLPFQFLLLLLLLIFLSANSEDVIKVGESRRSQRQFQHTHTTQQQYLRQRQTQRRTQSAADCNAAGPNFVCTVEDTITDAATDISTAVEATVTCPLETGGKLDFQTTQGSCTCTAVLTQLRNATRPPRECPCQPCSVEYPDKVTIDCSKNDLDPYIFGEDNTGGCTVWGCDGACLEPFPISGDELLQFKQASAGSPGTDVTVTRPGATSPTVATITTTTMPTTTATATDVTVSRPGGGQTTTAQPAVAPSPSLPTLGSPTSSSQAGNIFANNSTTTKPTNAAMPSPTATPIPLTSAQGGSSINNNNDNMTTTSTSSSSSSGNNNVNATSCSLCSAEGGEAQSFKHSKVFPFYSMISDETTTTNGSSSSYTDIECSAIADLFVNEPLDQCSSLRSSFFVPVHVNPNDHNTPAPTQYPMDIAAFCECPNTALPNACGSFCPAGTAVTQDTSAVILDIGTGMTCGKFQTWVPYVNNNASSQCNEIAKLAQFCCQTIAAPVELYIPSAFYAYNLLGLSEVSLQDGDRTGLSLAYRNLVDTTVFGNLQTTRLRRALVSFHRNLAVEHVQDSAKVYRIDDVKQCPTGVPANATCHICYGRYKLLLVDEDATAVYDRYTTFTQEVIRAGKLQNSLDKVAPNSVLHIAGTYDVLIPPLVNGSKCSFCETGEPNYGKVFPIPNPKADNFTCQSLVDLYAKQPAESCLNYGLKLSNDLPPAINNYFSRFPVDLKTFCECPGSAASSGNYTCKFFCPDGKRVPKANLDVEIDPAKGLTCGALEAFSASATDPTQCSKMRRDGAICCTEKTSAYENTSEATLAPIQDNANLTMVNSSFLVAHMEGFPSKVLMPSPSHKGLTTAYGIFVEKVLSRIKSGIPAEATEPPASHVSNTSQAKAASSVQRTSNETTKYIRRRSLSRHLAVDYRLNSAIIYDFEDAGCPADIPSNASCHIAFGSYSLLLVDENSDSVIDLYTNYTQAAINAGLLEETLKEIDPSSPFIVINASNSPQKAPPDADFIPRIVFNPGDTAFFRVGMGVSIAMVVMTIVGVICASDARFRKLDNDDDDDDVEPWKKKKEQSRKLVTEKSKKFSYNERRGPKKKEAPKGSGPDHKTDEEIYQLHLQKVEELINHKTPEEIDNIGELMDLFYRRELVLIHTLQHMPDCEEHQEEVAEQELQKRIENHDADRDRVMKQLAARSQTMAAMHAADASNDESDSSDQNDSSGEFATDKVDDLTGNEESESETGNRNDVANDEMGQTSSDTNIVAANKESNLTPATRSTQDTILEGDEDEDDDKGEDEDGADSVNEDDNDKQDALQADKTGAPEQADIMTFEPKAEFHEETFDVHDDFENNVSQVSISDRFEDEPPLISNEMVGAPTLAGNERETIGDDAAPQVDVPEHGTETQKGAAQRDSELITENFSEPVMNGVPVEENQRDGADESWDDEDNVYDIDETAPSPSPQVEGPKSERAGGQAKNDALEEARKTDHDKGDSGDEESWDSNHESENNVNIDESAPFPPSQAEGMKSEGTGEQSKADHEKGGSDDGESWDSDHESESKSMEEWDDEAE